ncbi:MAG: prepilin-type N-terminal cleavage/methylation domain-containing protein [Burkholderiaceae bacterium]|nr:prepilin-type N-terminal cleavage/methylation domain-containing protein [Burkholderiaceae bacterium]
MAALKAAGHAWRRGARGFTLLELLAVIVLAGILLSIVTISVAPDERQQLAREAERVGQLFALAADEARIRQLPIYWEADLNGYRFVSIVAGERRLLGDDLLRERAWREPLRTLVMVPAGATRPSQSLLAPGAPPLQVAIAREWIQTPLRLELSTASAQVAIDFDERGRGTVHLR